VLLYVIDLTGNYFCLQDEQFVETRMGTGLRACQWGIIHKDIHSHCGYPKKCLTIRHLAREHMRRADVG
jgi:hypothetical protein